MASSYNDKNNPNACIYGKILGGGKIKSWRLNANSYKIQKFKCNVEKECKEEHKKFITEGYFNNYYPLNGEIGSSLNGERGIGNQENHYNGLRKPSFTSSSTAFFTFKGDTLSFLIKSDR